MFEQPAGLLAEQCISTRIVEGEPEARLVEIMRLTNTMFVDDFEVRYARKTLTETTVRGEEAWKLHHRKNPDAISLLAQAA